MGSTSATCNRARKYLLNLQYILYKIDYLKDKAPQLLDAALRYTNDAKYYLDMGDCETALVAVSYAEGLIDALKYLGIAEPEWPRYHNLGLPKVFVAGTFDIIHPGHISLLEFASRMGRVYAVIARDINVIKSKGKMPLLSEASRLKVVSAIRYVYEARLGDPDNIMKPVKDISPDIVVLGPDQPFDEKALETRLSRLLRKSVKVIRYTVKREFEPGMRGSSDIIRKACCESYCRSMGCE